MSAKHGEVKLVAILRGVEDSSQLGGSRTQRARLRVMGSMDDAIVPLSHEEARVLSGFVGKGVEVTIRTRKPKE